MHSLHLLPNLPKIGIDDQSGGGPDYATAQTPFRHISNNMVQLPSIRELFREQDAPACSSMSRKASRGSASSSEQSMYSLSRSNSPMDCHMEPSQGLSRPFTSAAMITDHFQPYPATRLPAKSKLRCPACLELGETVFLDAKKKCSRCGRKESSHKPTGKVSRKKRTDRDLYSRVAKDNGISIKHAKGDGEAGRRYDHSYQHATLQNQMLLMNPDLPDVAAPGLNSEQIGWTRLKSNNICEDVSKRGVKPLVFNKLNILESTIQVHRDSNAILHDCYSERESLEDDMHALLRSDASLEVMRRFLIRTLEQDFATKIAASRAQLGAHGFQSPLQFDAKH